MSYQTSTSKVGRGRRLTGFDRVYIAFCLDSGMSITKIAAKLGRNKSVISREISRNRCNDGTYDPFHAQAQAITKIKRPKPRKIDSRKQLRRIVVRLLG
ncbi:helix-turn-helix domain-containing protein [Corynebacterium cystitidis]|uniref:helix-turn-helix domain-containing protein n=1 Tax=Corynebacterium cystitidis TaxID=35757 RepID=UPI00211E51E9|nr:helix-turn-helix domain-containing protein [Corynebacterium cystitidis]